MTSDAKVGLLLGLLFIFIIALMINGLPNLRGGDDNNELTTNMVRSQVKAPGIGGAGREVIRQTNGARERFHDGGGAESTDDQSIRYTRVLPRDSLVVRESDKDIAVVGATEEKKERVKVEPSKPALPKVYVVVAGENLSVIAKKLYGAEEGNRLANIVRIFEANRKVLKSADEICEGQKIIIPPLAASGQNKDKTDGVFGGTMFEKVKSIGKRYLSKDVSKTKAEASREYVVKEGDNLWRIAAARLGDGGRYTEIAKLNAGTLEDEDCIVVGMRLKIPAR